MSSAPVRTSTTPPVGRQVAVAVGMLLAVVVTAGLGLLANNGNIDGWYADAEKVAWNPPNWLFGPAWSILYLLIALSGFLLWRRGYRGPGQVNALRPELTLFAVQLVLNAAWSPAFFALYPVMGTAALWLALAVILALDVVVAMLIARTWRSYRLVAVLLMPYLAWIVFATTLNAGMAVLN